MLFTDANWPILHAETSWQYVTHEFHMRLYEFRYTLEGFAYKLHANCNFACGGSSSHAMCNHEFRM